jgi:hypothetical protein
MPYSTYRPNCSCFSRGLDRRASRISQDQWLKVVIHRWRSSLDWHRFSSYFCYNLQQRIKSWSIVAFIIFPCRGCFCSGRYPIVLQPVRTPCVVYNITHNIFFLLTLLLWSWLISHSSFFAISANICCKIYLITLFLFSSFEWLSELCQNFPTRTSFYVKILI